MIKIHLAKLLGEKKWTQKYLADITGIRPNTIHQMYHEFIDRINVEHIDKICDALGCEVGDLIEYIPNKKH